jgi:hypothetical protein
MLVIDGFSIVGVTQYAAVSEQALSDHQVVFVHRTTYRPLLYRCLSAMAPVNFEGTATPGVPDSPVELQRQFPDDDGCAASLSTARLAVQVRCPRNKWTQNLAPSRSPARET